MKNITIRSVPELAAMKFKLLAVGMGKTMAETLAVIVEVAWNARRGYAQSKQVL